MNRSLLLAAALGAAACGDVKDRADCRTSADCPSGEYCAHTSEGEVCWPDGVPPTVGGVTVTCAGPCTRDGALLVTAVASDDLELLEVEATLDLAGERRFPLTRVDGGWSGQIDLGTVPFPWMDRTAVVTVRARDGARNEGRLEAAQRPLVTRVRWEKALDAGLVIPAPPAVDAAGMIVVGGSDGKLRFFGADGEPAHTPLTVAAGAITQAPSIGAQAIWVGANDGKLYAVALDGSAVITARSCAASGGGSAKGPPAVLTTGGVDVAFGAFGAASTGRIVASTEVDAAPLCGQTPERESFSSGVAIGGDGAVVGATASSGNSTLRRFAWDGAAFEELWTRAVGTTVSVTPGFDASGRILTGGLDAELDLTTAAGVSAPLATLDGSIDESPIVLSDGDVVVGDASGKLHRIRPDGTAAWTPVDLGAALHAPMALTATDGHRWFLVATIDGKIHAVDDAGTELWSGALTGGQPLGAGNLHTPAGSAFSTAYFAGADGKLYAVAVEGRLDTASPWPKAWHDARNTSRAGGGF